MCVDMQLYFIAPAIVYLIQRFKAKAHIVALVSVLSCIGLTLASHVLFDIRNVYVHYFSIEYFQIFFFKNFGQFFFMFARFESKYMVLAYFPTHIRLSAWIIGFYTGYILTEFPNGSIRIPKVFFPAMPVFLHRQ